MDSTDPDLREALRRLREEVDELRAGLWILLLVVAMTVVVVSMVVWLR
jgi:hypothetical protein